MISMYYNIIFLFISVDYLSPFIFSYTSLCIYFARSFIHCLFSQVSLIGQFECSRHLHSTTLVTDHGREGYYRAVHL